MMEAWATQRALENIRGKRSFGRFVFFIEIIGIVLSRSTFASSGRHGFHWTGDVTSGNLFILLSHI